MPLPPGDLPDPGVKPASPAVELNLNLLQWKAGSLPLAPPGKPLHTRTPCQSYNREESLNPIISKMPPSTKMQKQMLSQVDSNSGFVISHL